MNNVLRFTLGRCPPMILQQQQAECGPACIAMVASYYGAKLDMRAIRVQCLQHNMSLQGMNLMQLIQLAQSNHLTTRAVQCSIEELTQLSLPCILHWDMQHFVVLTRIKRTRRGYIYYINDPAVGAKQLTKSDFSMHFTGIALNLEPSAEFVKQDQTSALRLRDLWGHTPGLLKVLAQIAVMSLCLQLLALTTPMYMQWIMDEVLLTFDGPLLVYLALGFTGVLLFSTGMTMLRSWLVTRCASYLALSLGTNVFAHLLKLPHAYFTQRHLGDIASRFGSVHAINERISSGIVQTLIDGVMAIGIIVMMLLYNVWLSVAVLSFMLLYGVIRWLFYLPLQYASLQQLEAQAQENSVFLESIRCNQTLTLFNQTARRQQIWQNEYVDTLNCGIRLSRWNISFAAIESTLFGIENIVVIFIATTMVMDQALSLGMLIAFIAYKSMFTQRIANLIEQAILFKMLNMHLLRLSDITHTPIQTDLQGHGGEAYSEQVGQYAKDAIKQTMSTPIISLENVSYHYPGSSELILNNINMQVFAGENVVISGPSGGGKTTLLKILLGLLAPSSGTVKFNGLDIKQIGLIAYRTHLGTVMQDDVLLAGSVLDNITFFADQVDQQQLSQVITDCQLNGVISQLPMGLHTLVGELGSQLSGGQVQRILLARAIYNRPAVLFLDEATSALDKHSEQLVSQAISALNMTKIQIAHRQETIEQAQCHYEISQQHCTAIK